MVLFAAYQVCKTLVCQSCRDLKPPPSASTIIPATSASKRSAGARSDRTLLTAMSGRQTPQASGSGSKFVQMQNSLNDIWDDFRLRTEMVRKIGRNLSLVRIKFYIIFYYIIFIWLFIILMILYLNTLNLLYYI